MAEDTQIINDQDRENLIAEMIASTPKVILEDDFSKNPVVDDGKTTGAPMVLKEINSAGYAFIWDTRTYDKVPVLYYMLQQKLRERREDGSFRFTTVDPKKEPVHGKILCMLHPDYPERSHYTELGFRSCKKNNLLNQFQQRRHMQLKHPQEWKAIEEERVERERQEDRELQQALIAAAGRGKGLVSTNVLCPECGIEFGTKTTMEKHRASAHGIKKE